MSLRIRTEMSRNNNVIRNSVVSVHCYLPYICNCEIYSVKKNESSFDGKEGYSGVRAGWDVVGGNVLLTGYLGKVTPLTSAISVHSLSPT